MAIKVDYVLRETGSNLARNITITIASILTVTVSLALVGASLMLRSAVSNATQRWQGGIEFVVFLNPDATQDQITAVQAALDASPDVERTSFIDKAGAYDEFKRLFSDSPEMLDAISPEDLPPSFRVVPKNKNADVVEALGKEFEGKPGVRQVVFASETIKVLQRFSGWLTTAIFALAVILLLTAGLLILNTIRMAMFARRREIEVQKLVGATNWFIRVPFMVEGLVQGVLGALLAIGTLAILRPFFERSLPNPDQFQLVQGFVVSNADVAFIYVLVAVVGCLVGTIGAGVAVTRFLDV